MYVVRVVILTFKHFVHRRWWHAAMPKWGLRVIPGDDDVARHLDETVVPRPVRGKRIVPQRQSATEVVAAPGIPERPESSKMLPRSERRTPVASCCDASDLSAISRSPDRVREWMEFIGSVSESREDHLLRHNGGLRSCPRCKWYRFANSWVTSYGGTECRAAWTCVLVAGEAREMGWHVGTWLYDMRDAGRTSCHRDPSGVCRNATP